MASSLRINSPLKKGVSQPPLSDTLEALRTKASTALQTNDDKTAESCYFKILALLDETPDDRKEQHYLWTLEARLGLLTTLSKSKLTKLVEEQTTGLFDDVAALPPLLYRPALALLNQGTEKLFALNELKIALSVCLSALSIAQRKPRDFLDELTRTRNNHGAVLITMGRIPEAEEILNNHLALVQNQSFPAPTLSLATFYNNLAELKRQRGLFPEAAMLSKSALRMRLSLLDEQHLLVAQSRHNLGSLEFILGRIDSARQLLEASLKVRLAAGEQTPKIHSAVPTLILVADILLQQRLPMEAIRYAKQALALCEKQFGQQNQRQIPICLLLVEIYRQLRQTSKAEELYAQAESLMVACDVNDPMQQASLLVAKAQLEFDQQNYSLAETCLEDSMKIIRKHQSQHHPEVSRILLLLARVYDRNNRDSRAKGCLNGAVELIRQAYGSQHYRLLDCLHTLATIHLERGYHDASEDYCQQMLDLFQATDQKRHGLLPQTYILLGRICQVTKRPHEARAHYRQAVDLYRELYSPLDHGMLDIYGELAAVEEILQDYQQSLNFGLAALEVAEQHYPSDNIIFGYIHHRMMNLYRKLKHLPEALENGHIALSIYEKCLGRDHDDVIRLRHELDMLEHPLAS